MVAGIYVQAVAVAQSDIIQQQQYVEKDSKYAKNKNSHCFLKVKCHIAIEMSTFWLLPKIVQFSFCLHKT